MNPACRVLAGRSRPALCTKLAIVRYTIALAVLACAAAGGAVLPPCELECEARRNPVGIDASQPRLFWKLRSDPQAGYQKEWFYAGLACIRPQDPGLRHIGIRPQPVGDLTWVTAKWETFRGPVAAAPAKMVSGKSSFNSMLLP